MSIDIVAFQVTKEHREPKTIWVNEYKDGGHAGHDTKEMSKKLAQPGATRIAVKYVEVIE